jgi:exopolysaccharide/PEP-CTERM locus tyrosine autokinase
MFKGDVMSRIDKAIEKATALRALVKDTPLRGTLPKEGPPIKGSAQEDERPGPHLLPGTPPLQINHPSIVSVSPDAQHVAEIYRKLKSVILHLTKGEPRRNTLLVTSSLSGEGKSITSINLACALARDYDHTVLLVDADLRKPSLHKYLNFEPKTGLLQCLKNNVPLSQALVKTGLGKLVVLPAGGVAEDPNELLASDQMKALVEEMKNRYPDRYIIFDTPPSCLFADSQVLSSHVDGVLFVVREGVASPKQIRDSLEGLHGSKVLGAVYNDALRVERQNIYSYY